MSPSKYAHVNAAYLANNFAEQEIIQLAQDEQHCSDSEEQHRPSLTQDTQDNICHHGEIEERRPDARLRYAMATEELCAITHAAGHIEVNTNKGTLFSDCGGLLGPNALVI